MRENLKPCGVGDGFWVKSWVKTPGLCCAADFPARRVRFPGRKNALAKTERFGGAGTAPARGGSCRTAQSRVSPPRKRMNFKAQTTYFLRASSPSAKQDSKRTTKKACLQRKYLQTSQNFGINNYLLENCGARRAPLRPYFFLSFIRGSRVSRPAFLRVGRRDSSYCRSARAIP